MIDFTKLKVKDWIIFDGRYVQLGNDELKTLQTVPEMQNLVQPIPINEKILTRLGFVKAAENFFKIIIPESFLKEYFESISRPYHSAACQSLIYLKFVKEMTKDETQDVYFSVTSPYPFKRVFQDIISNVHEIQFALRECGYNEIADNFNMNA